MLSPKHEACMDDIEVDYNDFVELGNAMSSVGVVHEAFVYDGTSGTLHAINHPSLDDDRVKMEPPSDASSFSYQAFLGDGNDVATPPRKREPTCDYPTCKRAPSGGTTRCISHGGGKTCGVDGCNVAAQSLGWCKKHGGGPRCTVDGCTKSAQGHGKCKAHGGGTPCAEPGCHKRAQRGQRCGEHGGFVLCATPECTRKDRGGGLCNVHRKPFECQVRSCKRLGKVDGMCTQHYKEFDKSDKTAPNDGAFFL
ncbi:hypothetical protein SPRG_01387 [Saprolegnia parasitica CBS 223.65]|uniref:WRKY19-like zinc finger domain-containing protein n=1 Tax=Saprolegnia parasitica (strain CBS 223.65) TaxID=695850 RepID=A0A067D5Z8_SAPPC|nr:hypothetical protein SPRG_01387 [Saprolegnia parasitica CBS 223.65]KDO34116.1 hypothetical protein SPRG_01387 [Saprolegnia parasitica CBS 223.65]|eukprot:XP_012194994.1 hypothetical protein SPRG_01387 [Saprolegnia parasitica CBS 223.65]